MINLAGNVGCDPIIVAELSAAGIGLAPLEGTPGEVPACICGRIGHVTLERAWVYWVANGDVPLEIAETFDAIPGIRAGGRCDAPGAAAVATYYDADGKRLESDPDGSHERQWDDLAARRPDMLPSEKRPSFVPDARAVAARAVVTTFHVDTPEALRFFADTLRRHGIGS